MDEIMMRMMAQVLGLEVMSFVVDYALPDGRHEHRAVQVVGTRNDRNKAARGVRDNLTAQGMTPRMIAYCPGDHTMADLEAMMDERAAQHKLIPVFVAEGVC